MIQTETTKAKILFLDLPNDIIAYGVHHAMDGNKRSFRVASETEEYELYLLPQGNWTILNTLDEVTEDEAALIAEIDPEIDFENTATRERLPTYIDYMDDGEYYLSPKNSIKSLATSLGVQGKTIILYELK